ncbi:MAG: hypothetical protein SWH61_09375 [Thermodesulfobacteriota bacterium]|nr:hypothetical protein [Thermodesulfobacteriota bacterium]
MKHNGNIQKKRWQTPILCILSRSSSEEAVLATCKSSFGLFGGPGDGNCASGQGWPPFYTCNDNTAS